MCPMQVKLENDQDIEVDLQAIETDYPFLWIQIDPEYVRLIIK